MRMLTIFFYEKSIFAYSCIYELNVINKFILNKGFILNIITLLTVSEMRTMGFSIIIPAFLSRMCRLLHLSFPLILIANKVKARYLLSK